MEKEIFTLQANAIPTGVTTIAGTVSAGIMMVTATWIYSLAEEFPENYPLSPKSFHIAKQQRCFYRCYSKSLPGFTEAGMITRRSGPILTMTNKPDLIVAGEWMPIRFFKNNNGQFQGSYQRYRLNRMNGMWRSLHCRILIKMVI